MDIAIYIAICYCHDIGHSCCNCYDSGCCLPFFLYIPPIKIPILTSSYSNRTCESQCHSYWYFNLNCNCYCHGIGNGCGICYGSGCGLLFFSLLLLKQQQPYQQQQLKQAVSYVIPMVIAMSYLCLNPLCPRDHQIGSYSDSFHLTCNNNMLKVVRLQLIKATANQKCNSCCDDRLVLICLG